MTEKGKIRALLFDMGRVIVPFDFNVAFQALQSHSSLSPETIRAEIHTMGLFRQFETGLLEPEDFVERLCTRIGAKVSHAQFCEIWSSIFDPQTLIPESFLSDLHVSHRLVLVSNTNQIHFEMIARNYSFLQHFDAVILSYKVKAMKPSPAIFEAAVKAAGCAPEECFFTDDIPEYVEAANAFGIDAVLFTNFEDLRKELEKRKVL